MAKMCGHSIQCSSPSSYNKDWNCTAHRGAGQRCAEPTTAIPRHSSMTSQTPRGEVECQRVSGASVTQNLSGALRHAIFLK